MEDVGAHYALDPERVTVSPRIREGRRIRDGLRVVVKTARDPYPSSTDLALIRHEHALLQKLDGAPVARPLGLVRVDHGLGLVLEHQGENSFDRLIARGPLQRGRFLDLAVLAAEALQAVHARGVIHKDIKPHHLFVDAREQKVVLIDFGIATALSHEEHRPGRLDGLEGTLEYMAPEQTGRMNRSVDRRSDLYALGVTLYQLLTGELPFKTPDPLELLHCHIARTPPPPGALCPDLPEVLSKILLRLLAKVAEDRYQTAAGLAADLRRCAAEYRRTGAIADFELGADDHAAELVIPEKLYGRAREVQSLVQALERVRSGKTELVLVSGGSGIGKSALVQELHKVLVGSGHFAAGKFDQYNRSLPYAALARACGERVRGELAAPTEQLEAYKRRLSSAFGNSAQVLIDVVPELELVLGRQPPAITLGPSESRNRFERLFQRFIQASASAEQPLVLFLDDLQWADAASLHLLELMLENPEQRQLLVIGNYRDAEVGSGHPLRQFIDRSGSHVRVTRIALEPLAAEHVAELLAEALPRHAGELKPFAELVLKKTGGNPFFVAQFLRKLVDEGWLRFDRDSKLWLFDLVAMDAAGVTDNVVELILAKLQRSSRGTQTLLKQAACIGHRFDSGQLATISGLPPSQLGAYLWEAVEQGFVSPLDAGYKLLSHHDTRAAEVAPSVAHRFTHDRVQQAAYALIPEAERAPLHLAIGRLLLSRCGTAEPPDELLFDIVGALNQGRGLMQDEERRRLCALDVRAAMRAKAAAAHGTAIELCDVALELLGDEPWQADHALSHSAHLIKAECHYLTGAYAEALAAIDALEQFGEGALERVPARNLKALLLTNQGLLREASATSLESLRLLGVTMPEPDDAAALAQAIAREFGAYRAAMARRSVESLADIEPMRDPEKHVLVVTLAQAIPAAFQWNPELMVLMVLTAVQLPLAHGTAPLSAFFYEQYGIVHALVTGEHATSFRYGQLGIELSQRPGFEPSRAGVEFIFAVFNSPWSRPLRDSIEHFRAGVRAGHDFGDQMHGVYCLGLGMAYRLYASEPLEQLRADLPSYTRAIPRNDAINAQFMTLHERTLACLSGTTREFGTLDVEGCSEAELEAELLPPVAAMYGAHKALLRFLGGRPAESLAATRLYQPLPMLIYNADYNLYRGLSAAELARSCQGDERQALIDELRSALEKHARWARSCPENFAHGFSLLEAEEAALAGRGEAAMSRYEEAITEAGQQGHALHQALANELCGRFHLRAGRQKLARIYLADARYQYERWGAAGKARHMIELYPELQVVPALRDAAQPTRHLSAGPRTATLALTSDGSLDLISAMRATQVIASELILERLIESVLRILVESAGARRGLLILSEAGVLVISATISVDPDWVELSMAEPVDDSRRLPASIVQYVARSYESVVIDDAAKDPRFARDEYINETGVKSLLCMPLLHHGALSAILYLEHSSASGVFNAARLERLSFLGSHAAVAIENARLYGELQAATERLEEANDTLEQKVRDRTVELLQRNEDMRRVLDNVKQGLISVDVKGRVAPERSAMVERWFGPFEREVHFATHMRDYDPNFAQWFTIGFDTLAEGLLPAELAVDQLPKRLTYGELEYRCAYSPIRSDGQLSGLLLVIEDVTLELARAREETAQREQLLVCQRLTQDRSGMLGFFEEGQHLLDDILAPESDAEMRQLSLHTLKGNAAVLGLTVLSERCHDAEHALGMGAAPGDALAGVCERWQALERTMDMVLGKDGQDKLELPRAEVARLLSQVKAGMALAQIAADLERWQLEPLSRPLGRLGAYARSLSERLGKGRIELTVSDGGVLVDAQKSRALWSVLVHVVRNAVDHGFEKPEERANSGKSELNALSLTAKLRAELVSIEITDDGRGVDWEAVRALAQQRGLPANDRAQLAAALTAPNLSTRQQVTDTSGRGIGLAAVDGEVKALGGSLGVLSEPGAGCTWQVTIPAAVIGAVGSPSVEAERRVRLSDRPGRASSSARAPA